MELKEKREGGYLYNWKKEMRAVCNWERGDGGREVEEEIYISCISCQTSLLVNITQDDREEICPGIQSPGYITVQLNHG